MKSEIYEVTAVEGKTRRQHKVYVRAASYEKAETFGRKLHKLFGVRGHFQTRAVIWNPINDLSMSRYISRGGK